MAALPTSRLGWSPGSVRTRIRSRWQPDVGDVPRIAGEWSVNPWRIGPRTRLVGQGFVAVTPWGRRQGVVFDRLS